MAPGWRHLAAWRSQAGRSWEEASSQLPQDRQLAVRIRVLPRVLAGLPPWLAGLPPGCRQAAALAGRAAALAGRAAALAGRAAAPGIPGWRPRIPAAAPESRWETRNPGISGPDAVLRHF